MLNNILKLRLTFFGNETIYDYQYTILGEENVIEVLLNYFFLE